MFIYGETNEPGSTHEPRVRPEALAEQPSSSNASYPSTEGRSAPPGALRGPHTGSRRWGLSTVPRETNPGDGEWQHA